jgi:amino acid transporter
MADEDGAVQRADGGQTVAGRKVVGYCLAILSVATAVIHFAVAGEHFQEYWLFGVFMLTVAWLQLAWAIVVASRMPPWLLGSGAIINAGIIVIYIVTRTVGDVIGPTPHDVEPFGFGDGLCTVLEAIIVAGC